MIYWFTGQPGHGKSVLSNLLHSHLVNVGLNSIQIDGDDIREIFENKDYSKEGRYKNITLAQQIAKFCHLKGMNAVVSLVSPYKDLRESFKREMGENILEFWVHTTEIRGRENYHSPDYERPEENFIDVDTTNISPDETLQQILNHINMKI
jgi:adenylylsulfate kinase